MYVYTIIQKCTLGIRHNKLLNNPSEIKTQQLEYILYDNRVYIVTPSNQSDM